MEKDVLNALRKSWSIQSSSKWSVDNPAKGQCGVTSLVVQDILGGEIRKTFLRKAGTFIILLMENERISPRNNFHT